MSRRQFASLLFCVALLAQIAAPLTRGVAMARSGETGAFVALCKLLHGDERDQQLPGKAGRVQHDHSCSLCQMGAGVAPFVPTAAPAGVGARYVTRIIVIKERTLAASALFARGPPARAPPCVA